MRCAATARSCARSRRGSAHLTFWPSGDLLLAKELDYSRRAFNYLDRAVLGRQGTGRCVGKSEPSQRKLLCFYSALAAILGAARRNSIHSLMRVRSMPAEKTETLIIGGGQAGLAMSEHLSKRGLAHLIVERQ